MSTLRVAPTPAAVRAPAHAECAEKLLHDAHALVQAGSSIERLEMLRASMAQHANGRATLVSFYQVTQRIEVTF